MLKLLKRWFIKDESICSDGHTNLSQCVDAFKQSYEYDFQEEKTKVEQKETFSDIDTVKLRPAIDWHTDPLYGKIDKNYKNISCATTGNVLNSNLITTYVRTINENSTYNYFSPDRVELLNNIIADRLARQNRKE